MNFSILALQSLVPNCQLSWSYPYDYENIDWLDERPIPTKTEWETEKARLIAYQPKQDCKDKAKEKISNCDWSVLEDVNLLNKQDFINYRAYLRNLILNPIEDPIWQTEPDPIWS